MTFNELKIGDWFYTNKGQEEIEMKISNTEAIIIYHKNKTFIGFIGVWTCLETEIIYCSSFEIKENYYNRYYHDINSGSFFIKDYDNDFYCFWSIHATYIGVSLYPPSHEFDNCDTFFSSDTFTFYVPEADKIFLKPIDKTKSL